MTVKGIKSFAMRWWKEIIIVSFLAISMVLFAYTVIHQVDLLKRMMGGN